MTENSHNAADSEVSEAQTAASDSGGADAAPPRAADGSHPLTLILKRIRAYTSRAKPPEHWSFLKKTPWVRRLKGNVDELVSALQTEFANAELVAAGVLIPSPDDGKLELSPVFGDAALKFVILCDPPGTPIDAVSSRGALSRPHPPCLNYRLAQNAKLYIGSQQLVITAVSDDDLSVLHRLGWNYTTAAGLETLSIAHARELFDVRQSRFVDVTRVCGLSVPAWQIAQVRPTPDPQTLRMLEHLEKIERTSDYDLSTLIDVWIPTAQEFSAIQQALASGNPQTPSARMTASLKTSRCSVAQALQFFRDGREVDYGTARRRLVRALERSHYAPQAAEAKAALDQLQRAFKTLVTDKFYDAKGDGKDGWKPLRGLMGADIAEQWFEGQNLVSAARSMLTGEYPRALNSIDLQSLRERLRLIDTFAKLYAAGLPSNDRRVAKRVKRVSR